MGRTIFFATIFLCIASIAFLTSATNSSQWLMIIVNPKLLWRLTDNFSNFSTNQHDELLSLSKDGMILGVGTAKISIKIGYISYDISSELTLEGGFLITGVGLFILGTIFFLATAILMNGASVSSNTASKISGKIASILLRLGSGVVLSGMVIYTVRIIKLHNPNTYYKIFFSQIFAYIQKGLMNKSLNHSLNDINISGDDLVDDISSLQSTFGWCFIVGWIGAGLSLVAGVISWVATTTVKTNNQNLVKS